MMMMTDGLPDPSFELATDGLPDLVQTDIMLSDFPDDFKTYVKEKDLLFQNLDKKMWGGSWVFWSRENHRCDRPPPPCSEIFDLGSETRIAATNPELITQNIKTVIEKILGLCVQVLVQFWIAIKIEGGRTLLTTRDQPFGIRDRDGMYSGLCRYRLIFKDYEINVESDEHYLDRVFRHRQPESTPNVSYYSCKEYSQRDHVVNINNIKGCLAVPVLEPSGQCCVGVLELVTAADPQVTNFAFVAKEIRQGFEALGLRSLKVYLPFGCGHEDSLKALREKQQRTVYRLTLVKGWNTEDIDAYSSLFALGNPDFVEIKGVTYCGSSATLKLTMENVPWHSDVKAFSEALAQKSEGNYEVACEHVHSCCILLAKVDKFKVNGRWFAWIYYERFHDLVTSGRPFDSNDYMAATPSWAVYRAEEGGFDPGQSQYRKERHHKSRH